MKIRFLLFFFCCFAYFSSTAQEFWDPADFEIGNREIRPSLSNLNSGMHLQSNFNLPSGQFLNLPNTKKEVNMVALIEKEGSYQKPTVDIGSPLPKKEKKTFEISGETKLNDRDEVRNEALHSNPFYRNQQFYQNRMQNRTRSGLYSGSYYSPHRPYYY